MKIKHGKSHNIGKKNVLYNRYNSMKASCYRPKHSAYKNNGARGITVCDLWKNDFMEFYNWAISHGFTNKRVLHRIDRDREFSPENCRWVSHKTKNKIIAKLGLCYKAKLDLFGDVYSIKELSELLNISYSKLYYNLTRQGVGKDIRKINLENFDKNFQIEILETLSGEFKPVGDFEEFKQEIETIIKQKKINNNLKQ